jgi:basic membrane lipoprotein Med (substrate-binding protein (PBP1-ABC) superfamily)
MKRRFFVGGVLALCGAALFAGCGGNTTTDAPTNGATASNGAKPPLKVGMLLSGDVNDQGWNQLGYEGLQAVNAQTGAAISKQITKNPSDRPPALRDYGDQKYDLVFCYGSEYEEPVRQVAKDFPDTKFVIVAGNLKQEPNVATLVPKLEEATYLLGMAAGGLTKTGKVGMIGGMELPVIQSTFDAFALGAKAANPKVQVLKPVYVGNFEDQNAGKEAAKSLIAQGADILIHNADQAGKGMFDAAKEAGGKVLVFGTNRDQNAVAPDVTLGSAVIEMPRAFVQIAKAVQDKSFKAQFYTLDLKNGDISVHWNAALKNKIPPALMKKIEAAQAQIKSGKLKIQRNV